MTEPLTPPGAVVVCQMEVIPGNPEANLARILRGIDEAAAAAAEVVVFPEMALPGYLIGDEWENDALLRDLAAMNDEIAAHTRGRCAAIWGSVAAVFGDHFPVLGRRPPTGGRGADGRTRKYNAAFVAADGRAVGNGVFPGFTPKSLLPTYREFDDERHFCSLPKLAQEIGVPPDDLLEPFALEIAGRPRRVGVILCEDMWDDDYAFKPVAVLRRKDAGLILNLSASPFGIRKQAKRRRLLAERSRGCEFILANCVGAQDNGKNVFVFDGASPVFVDGRQVAQGPSFREALVTRASGMPDDAGDTAEIHAAVLAGLRALFARVGATKVVVGISGGIDSAVVTVLCTQVLGRDHVVGVTMPSRHNSATTRGLAAALAENLGIRFLVVPIEESAEATRGQVAAVTGSPVAGLVDENIQARDRGSRVLAAVAAQLGAIERCGVVFTNNGNKTEVAQGYCTLYGDVNGAVAPLADLYKTQVYDLARHLNATCGGPIPEGMLRVKPSAELSAAQNPEQGGGDPFQFEYHDRLLYQFVELRRDPEDILAAALAGRLEQALGLPEGRRVVGGFFADAAAFVADLELTWRRLKTSFFKRVQAPPIVAVSKRAFGFDLREAQIGPRFTRRYSQLKAELLAAP
ncbi:MAG: NAD(+) synthase [Planctomycetaceae bacterium]